MDYTTIRVEATADVIEVVLNRPAVHNAFNDELIGEAIDLFSNRIASGSARAVVLRGEGPSFCAGADLHWMSQMVSYSTSPFSERVDPVSTMSTMRSDSPTSGPSSTDPCTKMTS